MRRPSRFAVPITPCVGEIGPQFIPRANAEGVMPRKTLRQKDRARLGRSGEKAISASPKEHAAAPAANFSGKPDRGGMNGARGATHAL